MKRKVHQKFGKKIILSVAAIIGLSVCKVSAQDPNFSIGPIVGAQYTTIVSNSQTFTGGFAYNGGLSLETRITPKFGLELQGLISTLHASTQYKDSVIYNGFTQRFNNNYTFDMSWIQAHLLFKYFIRLGGDPITPYDRPQGSGNFISFFAGPYIGLIPDAGNVGHVGRTGTQVQQKHINFTPDTAGTKTYNTYSDNSVQEAADRLALTNIDLGYTLGVGLTLRLSSAANLDFSVRYSSSLTSLDNTTPTGDFFLGHRSLAVDAAGHSALAYTNATATNTFIALNVGLKFKLFGDSF